MRRLGGVVLFLLLAGCGTAPVPTAAEVDVTTTMATTSTSTTVAPTTTTSTTRARATTAAPRTTTAPAAAAAGGCNPNYAGACIPTGPDVDCGELTAKRFQVVGQDVYRLDADKDGIACES